MGVYCTVGVGGYVWKAQGFRYYTYFVCPNDWIQKYVLATDNSETTTLHIIKDLPA